MTVYFNKGFYGTPLNFKNVFTKQEIARIIQLGEKEPLTKALVGDRLGQPKDPHSKDRSSLLSFLHDNEDNEFIYKKLYNFLTEINREYFNFDIKGIESLQYTVYNEQDHYTFHTDIIDGDPLYCRKLSMTVCLTDSSDYEGGNLEFFTVGTEPWSLNEFREIGSVTVFPSYLVHRVSKVTKGTRRSLVVWFVGPGIK